jgi:hypothetical protein
MLQNEIKMISSNQFDKEYTDPVNVTGPIILWYWLEMLCIVSINIKTIRNFLKLIFTFLLYQPLCERGTNDRSSLSGIPEDIEA